MPRPGGNPDLVKHQYPAPEGRESNNERINFWGPKSMREKLDKLGSKKAEFLRQAVAKALDELD